MEPKIPIREKGKPTQYVPVSDIEYLEADRAYCIFHFKNKTEKTFTGSLKEYLAVMAGKLRFLLSENITVSLLNNN